MISEQHITVRKLHPRSIDLFPKSKFYQNHRPVPQRRYHISCPHCYDLCNLPPGMEGDKTETNQLKKSSTKQLQ